MVLQQLRTLGRRVQRLPQIVEANELRTKGYGVRTRSCRRQALNLSGFRPPRSIHLPLSVEALSNGRSTIAHVARSNWLLGLVFLVLVTPVLHLLWARTRMGRRRCLAPARIVMWISLVRPDQNSKFGGRRVRQSAVRLAYPPSQCLIRSYFTLN